MKDRKNLDIRLAWVAILAACVLAMSASCASCEQQETGDSDNEITLQQVEDDFCDGSDELVLAVRLDTFHNVAAGAGLFFENGRTFIYVDGHCDYWVSTPPSDDPRVKFSKWQSPRAGTLTEEEMQSLLERLQQPRWSDLYGQYYASGSFTDPSYVLWTRKGVAKFDFNVADEDTSVGLPHLLWLIGSGYQSVREELAIEGRPHEPGPVRALLIYEGDERWWDDAAEEGFRPWPDETMGISAADLAAMQEDYCLGEAYLFEGDAAELLRSYRDDYRQHYCCEMIAIESDDRHYRLYFRDVLPYENEHGLIEVGEYGDPLCRIGLSAN